MGSIQNGTRVHYCCVSKGERILYAYGGGGGGDDEIENLAKMCLQRTPPYHKWYFQTMGRKTFGFLMEENDDNDVGYVYFAIVDEGLGHFGVVRFLERVRDEFRKVAKEGSRRSMSNLSSLCMQEQLVPVIHGLISSLERVSQTGYKWPAQEEAYNCCQVEVVASTKAPLLSKSGKKEKKKKKMKDHVIAMRDIELEEHRKSTDRGGGGGTKVVDIGTRDSNDHQSGAVSTITVQKKDFGGLRRTRSGTQSIRKNWCRLVRIVLAIDAAVCLVLFVIWLIVCGGTVCLG